MFEHVTRFEILVVEAGGLAESALADGFVGGEDRVHL
jgi:hypothetical protein